MNISKTFFKYVSLNVLGMIGTSLFIFIDTFFIASVIGSTGLASLNFSIPVFALINAIGLMIGIGTGTKYTLLKANKEHSLANKTYTNALYIIALVSIILVLAGIFFSLDIATLLGANNETLGQTNIYLKTILIFGPAYLLNHFLICIIRNDNNPKLAMIGMLTSSLSNIVLDYIFIYPLNLGMFGAAFATSIAAIFSIVILSSHIIRKKNGFHIIKTNLCFSSCKNILSLRIFAFINEASSSVVIIAFNLTILSLAGNIGVAAYGIIANIALIGVAIFTGIAQGIQPIVSTNYGKKNYFNINKVLKYSIISCIIVSIIIYISIFLLTNNIIHLFNNENNSDLHALAFTGLRIYFIGYFFAGLNIVLASYLNSIEKPKYSFYISISRGLLVIVPSLMILSSLFKINGVWASFAVTELLVLGLTIILTKKNRFLI